MPEDVLVELLREMLYLGMWLALPPLGVAMAIGVLVGLVQAITSIQEQTLSFIPKVLSIVLVFVLLGSWMVRMLVNYATELFGALPEYGGL